MDTEPWITPPKRKAGCCFSLTGWVLVVGVVGACLGVAALTAYGIVQTPTIRGKLGDYFNTTARVAEHTEDSESENEKKSLYSIAYTIEIILVVVGGLLGIFTNSALIYGVVYFRRWFLIHWLVFHVLVVIAGLVAAILLIILQVGVYKVYTLIPIGIIVVVIIAWIMVYELFCKMGFNENLIQQPCQIHPLPVMNYPDGMDMGGGGYNTYHQWTNKKEVLEFYPQDKLTRNMQERLKDPHDFRDDSSTDRHIENTIYCESEETDSSILQTNERRDEDYNNYTTLPVEYKLDETTQTPNYLLKIAGLRNDQGYQAHYQSYQKGFQLDKEGHLAHTNMQSFKGHYGGIGRHLTGSRGREWSVGSGGYGIEREGEYVGSGGYGIEREGEYEAVEARRRADTPFSSDGDPKLTVGNRISQESKTDSNITNAEI